MVESIQTRSPHEQPVSRMDFIETYQKVRRFTEYLCEPLATEDYVIQSMPDVSPTKWHLAHVSWFFETFLLLPTVPGYRSLHPQYAYLFNSYYNTLGERHCRPNRGLISRPTVKETYEYRRYVDKHMLNLLENIDEQRLEELAAMITLGFHHEQQHQELIVTDIKHVLAGNPLYPAYKAHPAAPPSSVPAIEWSSFPEGVYWIGHEGNGFAFDNEGPRHREFVQSFQLASRLVTNGEYLEFIESGGYRDPLLWLSEGWATVNAQEWQAPLYWEQRDGRWYSMTLSGLREIDRAEPACHISYYEADA
ncbi:MAG TPA: ergothioneine biosynthesis protein EgtB, partial [Ktedonobacteraceae bacterium]